jgi:hypothetical protein
MPVNPRRPLRLAFRLFLSVACLLALAGGLAIAAKHRQTAPQNQVSRSKCVVDRVGRSARGSLQRGRRQRRGSTAPARCVKTSRQPGVPADPGAAVGPPVVTVEPSSAATAPAPVESFNPDPATAPPAPEPPEPEPPAPEPPEPEPPAPEPPEPEPPSPGTAQAEDFAGEPSSVLLGPTAGVDLDEASRCVGLDESGDSSHFGGVDPGPVAGTIRLELVPAGEMPETVRCPVASETREFEVLAAAPAPGGVVTDPIDSKYLTEVPFGRRSFWIQPWRAYLDTWPASRLLNAVGINFNVTANEADGTARLLQSSGFELARIELSWNLFSYDDPTKLNNEAETRKKLIALREHGLRPLILLNANSSGPGPAKMVALTTTAAAAVGATAVRLSSASAAEVVPGKTGFANLSFGGEPDILIKSVDDEGVAVLSRPLPVNLPAGAHQGSTLRYAPFGPPRLSGGVTNPDFQATLAGWLQYVAAVSREAESVFGAGGYDLEVWNELSFGSEFLYEEKYYSPPRVSGEGSVSQALLEKTIAYVRDPTHGISPAVGITNGFASQTPFASGGSVPAGTTALSKHLYAGPRYFPRNAVVNSIRPIDALGVPDFATSTEPFTPRFTPEYASALPEYFLTATQTETLIRDIAPMTTSIYGVPHGRMVSPPGAVPPQVWMTEYNLNTNALFPLDSIHPDRYIGPLYPAQEERVQAEIVLRSLVSMVSKGVGREYFYAAAHSEGYDLISEAFMDALSAQPNGYPGDQLGGDTLDGLRRMLARFQGPGPGSASRQLQLLSIAQEGNHAVFQGDGTAAHPDLYDRDLLAVLPFQSAPDRFVIPFYVMTPNLTTVQDTGAAASSATRFDLPGERFRILLGGLPETSDPPEVSAYDPLRDEATSARLVSRQKGRAVFELSATNYPRTLTLDFE